MTMRPGAGGTPAAAAGGSPIWLPARKVAGPVWDDYIEELWQLYQDDFTRRRASFRGKPVWTDIDPISGGRHFGFWHLVGGIDAATQQPLPPDRVRCERLCWVRAVLEAPEAEVRTWRPPSAQGRLDRTFVALPDFSFAVVLKERSDRVFLKSAYPASHQGKRDRWRGEWEADGNAEAATPEG